jgi:hypothetical protein
MPDPLLILKASATAFVLAAITMLLVGGPWRRLRPCWFAAGGAIGVGVGLLAGAWLLGVPLRFPPREDLDRLLVVLLPAVVGVEVVAGVVRLRPVVAWSLRTMIAAGAARVLLHGSVYIAGSSDANEASPGQMWLILAGLAIALAVNWALLDRLADRAAGRSVVFSLALAAGGAGATVMLSGYATGGEIGMPLAAGLVGVAAASLFFAETPGLRGTIGVGIVGLFSLLVVGRFFGNLTTANFAALFAAPLLGWLPELLPARRAGPRVRSAARMVLVAAPVAIVLILAAQKFSSDSASPSAKPGANEPSSDDYMNFRK